MEIEKHFYKKKRASKLDMIVFTYTFSHNVNSSTINERQDMTLTMSWPKLAQGGMHL